MNLQFFGAAQSVTGSMHLVEANGHRVLLDCGMVQGDRTADERNRVQLSGRDAKLDFVVLTHAHIDHSGLLPRLAAQGFRGRVYATPATADLCGVMLPDSAHIQEKDAQWARERNGGKGGRSGRGGRR